MKVLLVKDLKKVGKRGEIVEVSDGYGANYVIPQGYGKFLNEAALKEYKDNVAAEKALEEKNRAEAIEFAKKLDVIELVYEAKAGKSGVMIGSISTKHIAQKLKDEYDYTIDKRKFIDKYPVNAFGYTKLRIELYKGVVGVINVKVIEKKDGK